MKIVFYKTAAADTIKQLDELVNDLIDEGYQPFGSPYFIGATEGNVDSPICQAMMMSLETAAKRMKAEAEIKSRKAK